MEIRKTFRMIFQELKQELKMGRLEEEYKQ